MPAIVCYAKVYGLWERLIVPFGYQPRRYRQALLRG